jgi:hypothetical protein
LRRLKNAVIVRTATNQEGAELAADGRIEVFATNKATLFELAAKTRDVKVQRARYSGT